MELHPKTIRELGRFNSCPHLKREQLQEARDNPAVAGRRSQATAGACNSWKLTAL
jgi:hypothetical protein